MYSYSIEKKANRELEKLPINIQAQIITKIKFFVDSETPLLFAKRLKDSKIGTYRFRVGTYRIIFDVDDKHIKVLSIGHRKNIYK